jgi:hypothetical protein
MGTAYEPVFNTGKYARPIPGIFDKACRLADFSHLKPYSVNRQGRVSLLNFKAVLEVIWGRMGQLG